VGAVIPVLYNVGDTAMILSAKVITVLRDNDGTVLSLDVEYICDNTIERGVMLGRVKVSGDAPSPTPFLLALQETLNRIGGLTPNRADLHAELTASVDFQLWMQMLSHQAMTARDVSSIFAHVFSCISKLQAPVRSEPFTEWTSEYLRLIASASSFEAAIPLLPLVFEFAGAAIDEIRRDVSLLSTLPTTLHLTSSYYSSTTFSVLVCCSLIFCSIPSIGAPFYSFGISLRLLQSIMLYPIPVHLYLP
jgi:hypothetical protein